MTASLRPGIEAAVRSGPLATAYALGWRGFRTTLASVLDAAGIVDAALLVRRVIPVPFLPIITYHRIRASDADDGFDEGVVDATPETFDGQVRLLKRSFNLIGVDELAEYVHGGRPLPPNAAMITFDDGYRECHDVALPILLRHGAKATFFVASSFVTERRIFWWDAIGHLVGRSRHKEVQLTYPLQATFRLDRPASRQDAVTILTRLVKNHHGLDIRRFLDEFARALDVPWSPAIEHALASTLIMTWDQIRALKSAGMDVQSHTRTHRVLHTLPEGELDDELTGSRSDLEAQLDAPVRALAYPVGQSILPSTAICAAFHRAGYQLGFSSATGTNALRTPINPLDIRRLAADSSMPDAYFRATVMFPALAHPAR